MPAPGLRWGRITLAALVAVEALAYFTEPAPVRLEDPYAVRLTSASGVPIALENGPLALRRDASCGFVLAPDQVLQGKIPDGRHATVKVNAQGFRGDDWKAEKPAGRVRVIVFGGASAFGAGSSTEAETVPGHLQRLLAPMLPEGRTIEVWNAGVPGYDSARALSLLTHRLMEWKPDALVLLDGWTDFSRGLTTPTGTALADPLFLAEDALCESERGGLRRTLRGSAAVRRIEGAPPEMSRLSLDGSGPDPRAAFAGVADLPDRPDASVRYYRNLLRLGALARGTGVKLILATEPELFLRASPVPKEEESLRQALPEAYARRARTAYPRFATAAAAVARETGAVAVDCASAFDGRGDSVFVGPARISDRGCQLVAERIAPPLLHMLFEEEKR